MSKNISEKLTGITGNGFNKIDFKDINKSSFIYDAIFLHPYSTNEIINYINNLNKSTTFYEYNLSNKVLKMTATNVSPLSLI